MAFVGLFAYMISMMSGGTLKGLSWIEGNAFIESVVLMKQFWIWRAIGGSLMFVSHLLFAYNFYTMVKRREAAFPGGTKKALSRNVYAREEELMGATSKSV